ncbi:MAG: endonuclease/exonuclease/phosphatase family protein [Pseudomonadota bacterium]
MFQNHDTLSDSGRTPPTARGRPQGEQAIALVSKHPFSTAPLCSTVRAFLITSVVLNGQTLHLAAIHLHWPWPAPSAGAEQETWAALAALDGLVVLAGDFNAFPWSTRMRRIRAVTGSAGVGPLLRTLHHDALPVALPIDHVLAPRGGRVTIRPLLGSDHKGIVAHVHIPEG